MIGLLRLCRFYYAVPMSAILTLTIWYALGDAVNEQLPAAIRATLALGLVICGGYALNDVCDRRVDRINAPHRPIPSGQVRPALAAWWAVGLLTAGLIVALFCRWQFAAVLAVVVGLLALYDLTSKHIGLAKQLIVAVLMTSFYPLAFAQAAGADSSRVPTLYLFPIWIFLTSFGYETLKDIRDIRGDRVAVAGPTWVQQHPARALIIARVTVVLGAFVLIGPAFAGCGWIYLAIIPAAIAMAVVSAFLPPRRAIMCLYTEHVLVGVAATADIMVLGC